jgi:hypothetical protein
MCIIPHSFNKAVQHDYIEVFLRNLIIIIIIIIIIINSHIGHCTHTSESANVKVQ